MIHYAVMKAMQVILIWGLAETTFDTGVTVSSLLARSARSAGSGTYTTKLAGISLAA